ncbi:MAG: hypothetical protein KJ000_34670 [Pirellulaceae bacterium]|nr:hypothetical protein [Pirellulaceae bacterium]
MMRILLVDDDENKISQVLPHVRRIRPNDDVEVRRSYQSGLREVVVRPPELLLLDMTMPTYDVQQGKPGGRERRYAGREILRQMKRRGICVPTIVITQYERFEEDGREITLIELARILHEQFPGLYCGIVYYQASGGNWPDELQSLIGDLARENVQDA